MSKKRIFVVNSNRPATIEGQFIEKRSGQTLIEQGSPKVLYANRVQENMFPNRCMLWGVRLDKDGNVPQSGRLDIKSSNYNGKIKFLPWNDPKGELIEVRYLKGYQSLDKQYQTVVLNADASISERDESVVDAFYVTLLSGENEFDSVADATKILYLENCQYNCESKSKDPNTSNCLFYEKKEEVVIKQDAKVYNSQFKAQSFVENAATDASLLSLKNLRLILLQVLPGEIEDEALYVELSQFAQKSPDVMLGAIEQHRIAFANLIEKANSYKFLDVSKNGTLVAVAKADKVILAEEIPANKDKMLEWVLENVTDPKSYDSFFKLQQVLDKHTK